MAIGVTATYNSSYHSPGFAVAVTGLAGYDVLTVERVDVSGEYPDTPVRGADVVSVNGNDFAVTDYEAPAGKSIVYRAIATSRLLTDDFSRTATDGWGTGPGGLTWGWAGGTSSLYSASGNAQTQVDALNTSRRTYLLGLDVADVDITCDIRAGELALGGTIELSLMARYTNADNYYTAEILFHAGASMTLRSRKVAGGVFTTLGQVGMSFDHVGADWYKLRLQVVGATIRAKLWRASTPQPDAWGIEQTDLSHTSGTIGTRANLAGINTNTLPYLARYDNLIVRGVGNSVVYQEIGETPTPGDLAIPVDYEGQAWLKSVGTPALSRRVNVAEWNDTERSKRVLGEYEVLGRSKKVVVVDSLSGREGVLKLATYRNGNAWAQDSSYKDLQSLLELGGTLLLQTTGVDSTGEADLYCEITGVSRRRVGVVGGDFVHIFDIDYVEVDRPSTAEESLGLRTWQTVLDESATWNEVITFHPTWLSVLQTDL